MGVMDTVYLICMTFGLVYTLMTLFWGGAVSDWLEQAHLPVLQPVLLVSGITAFGAAGLLLSRLTSFSAWTVLGLAAAGGAALAVLAYFVWVEPMAKAENSTGYSMQQLVGQIGEVWTSIPSGGLGEVLIAMVAGTTHHMAASVDGEPIREGTRVVVVEVRDHVLHVTPFPHYEEKESML
ncbi:NfeD family protein [Brevibacillus thermoruber]|uniref:NfeD family protein n=1 Tax=Brevibacillus thermoruber TaxID=33942 RepID=UPI0040434F5A